MPLICSSGAGKQTREFAAAANIRSGCLLNFATIYGERGIATGSVFSRCLPLVGKCCVPYVVACGLFGVPCSVWGRWWIEIKYARLSTHLAMLGMSGILILFHFLFLGC
jgi:hypothetical protein